MSGSVPDDSGDTVCCFASILLRTRLFLPGMVGGKAVDYFFEDVFFEDDNKGYVIRCVNRDTGRVIYRGSHKKYSRQKDALRPKDTYTFSGAKKALLNLERLYPDGSFYSIEKLSSYYDDFDSDAPDKKDYREKIFADIDHAMVRLDELWEGNDFHRGDKMRINEVRAVLKRIKERLLVLQ